LSEEFLNAPGKSLTAVVVTYARGGKSAKHHHSGSVFVYVLSGAIRSETAMTGPARICKAGEGFFEPPGSEHLVFGCPLAALKPEFPTQTTATSPAKCRTRTVLAICRIDKASPVLWIVV
jgi:hypothetical protein